MELSERNRSGVRLMAGDMLRWKRNGREGNKEGKSRVKMKKMVKRMVCNLAKQSADSVQPIMLPKCGMLFT